MLRQNRKEYKNYIKRLARQKIKQPNTLMEGRFDFYAPHIHEFFLVFFSLGPLLHKWSVEAGIKAFLEADASPPLFFVI